MEGFSEPPETTDATTLLPPELLQVAARLFRTKGYAATSTRELAAEFGVRTASLYHYVRGKDDLLFAICLDSVDRIQREVSKSVGGETDQLAKLQAFVRAHLRTVLEDRDKQATMLLEIRSLPIVRRTEILARRKAYVRLLREILTALQSEGRIRGDITAKRLSLAIFNTMNWTILWYQLRGEDSVEDILDYLVSFILAGVKA